MEDWNAPKHQWPSVELVSTLGYNTSPNPKETIVRAVWNSITRFASVSYWVEGGYLPMADNKGNLLDHFAGEILPALGLPKDGEASAAFGRLILRDLTTALAASDEPYGPEGRSAYLSLDSRGELTCSADLPGQPRRHYKRADAVPKAA